MEAPRRELSKNIQKVASAIFEDSEGRESFLKAVEEGQRNITALAWLHADPLQGRFQTACRPPWAPSWIDVAVEDERPGRSQEHDQGEIYCLDLSSVFACAPLAEIKERVGVIVDVCAAPGGKGILARRYLNPDLLIGNEVIRKRTAQLISNYKRCRIDPAIVTSCDPGLLGSLLEEKAHLVLVDAPCSGQSLVLKDLAAPGAFHPATISMNERRQRRILATSARMVVPGGYLLYATCTFSPEENERNVEWFVRQFPDFHAVVVPSLSAHLSRLTKLSCYRLFPQERCGAGAFCCMLKRAGSYSTEQTLTPASVHATIRSVWHSSGVSDAPLDTSHRTNTTDHEHTWRGKKRVDRRLATSSRGKRKR